MSKKEKLDIRYDYSKYREVEDAILGLPNHKCGAILNAVEKEFANLQQQLANKDKEIEQLKSALEYNENNIPNQRKAIRHQVINEIREEIVYYTISRLANDGSVLENCWGIKMKDLNKLLDQIEGKNDAKN